MGRKLKIVALVCGLASALVLSWLGLQARIRVPQAPARTPAQASPKAPGVPEPEGGPAAGQLNLWDLKTRLGGNAGDLDCPTWKTLRNPSYVYTFAVPANWNVEVPKELNRDRARVASPPGRPDIRFIAYPFGVYDRPMEPEARRMFDGLLPAGYDLGSVSPPQTRWIRVGERRGLVARRHFAFEGRPGVWQITATYVAARPKCFALVLLTPAEDLRKVMPIYERIVQSFRHTSPEEQAEPNRARGGRVGAVAP